MFQAIQKPYAHYTNQCFGVFFISVGDFEVYLGGDSFSQKSSKIKAKKNIEDLVKF